MNSRKRSERILFGFGRSFGELNPNSTTGICAASIQSASALIETAGGLIVQKVQNLDAFARVAIQY